MIRAEKRQAARVAKLKEKQDPMALASIDSAGHFQQVAYPLKQRKDKVDKFKSIYLKSGTLLMRTHKKGRVTALVTAPIRNLKVA